MVDRTTLANTQADYSAVLAKTAGAANSFPSNVIFAVPGYHYVGNGVNDAWAKWDAYIVKYHTGDPLLSHDQTGVDRMEEYMAEYKSLVANPDGSFSDYENLLPTNAVDWAAFHHDEYLPIQTTLAGQFGVNTQFALEATIGGIEHGDPLGIVFGAIIESVANLEEAAMDGLSSLGSFLHSVAVGLGLQHDDTPQNEQTAESSADNGDIVRSEAVAFSDDSTTENDERIASTDTGVPGIASDWEEYDGPLPSGQGPAPPPDVASIRLGTH